jgi:hypothetical protein
VRHRSADRGGASALPPAALRGGAAVKSRLLAALSSSLTADRDYLAWARQRQDLGCASHGPSGAYHAAVSASQRADAAKKAFVRVWNPVAARYGIRHITVGDF